jgi:hypothetical protein
MMKSILSSLLNTSLTLLLTSSAGCPFLPFGAAQRAVAVDEKPAQSRADNVQLTPRERTPRERMIAGALEQTTYTFSYDPAYVKLDYPNGDVPLERGVCADVVVRALRKGGVDLQQEVHEDITRHFSAYPQKWRARRADRNIDHRRVANLMTFFTRKQKALPLSEAAQDYLPGDIVAWELSSGLLHIGVVSAVQVAGEQRYAIVHNISAGARLEDVLFAWKIIGHYRYFER